MILWPIITNKQSSFSCQYNMRNFKWIWLLWIEIMLYSRLQKSTRIQSMVQFDHERICSYPWIQYLNCVFFLNSFHDSYYDHIFLPWVIGHMVIVARTSRKWIGIELIGKESFFIFEKTFHKKSLIIHSYIPSELCLNLKCNIVNTFNDKFWFFQNHWVIKSLRKNISFSKTHLQSLVACILHVTQGSLQRSLTLL